MRKNNIFRNICCLVTITLTAGCSNELAEKAPADNNLMTFSVMHPAQKESTRATDTGFETNDRIGLFVTEHQAPLQLSGNYVNNALLSYNGSAWTPSKPIYWNDGTYDAFAYYPYNSPLTSVDDYPFSVAIDQSVPQTDQALGGYESSDFLYARSLNITASGQPVALQFRHCMSKLMIRLIKGEDYEGELPDEAEVFVHNTVPDATIDLSVGVVTRNPYSTARSIKALEAGEHRYTAIIVPQRIDNRQPLIEVVMKGVSYLYESKFLFKPGIQHLVSLVITKNPEQVKIEIGGEIEDWE